MNEKEIIEILNEWSDRWAINFFNEEKDDLVKRILAKSKEEAEERYKEARQYFNMMEGIKGLDDSLTERVLLSTAYESLRLAAFGKEGEG